MNRFFKIKPSPVVFFIGAVLLPTLLIGQAQVVAVTPLQNALNVASNTNLTATFNGGMNAGSFNDTTFIALGSLSGLHLGAINYNPATRTVTLDPGRDFMTGEVVTVILTRAVIDSLGNPLAGYAWNFTVASRSGTAMLLAPVYYPVGTGPNGLFAGFVNNDTILDLVATNLAAQNFSVLIGNGDGTFLPAVNYATGVEPTAVCLGDLDRDGDNDCVVACAANNKIFVYLNNGSGVMVPASQCTTGTYPVGVGLSDFNRDGRMDVVTVNRAANNISVFFGIGNGTFNPQGNYPVGGSPSSVAPADLDQDGDIDLLVSLRSNNKLKIMINNGDGTFATGQQYTAGSKPAQVFAGPLNASDRFIDAATANNNAANVSVLPGIGDGTFGTVTSFPSLAAPSGITAADLDFDGDLDLCVSNTAADTVTVLLNNGSAAFDTLRKFPAGDSLAQICAGDFNGDGAIDVAVICTGTNQVAVLINSSDTIPPGPPQNLTANGANPSPWTANPIFSLNWINPAEPSGIKRSLYKLSSPPTANFDTTGTLSAIPPDSVQATVLGGQALYLWLEDNIGNLDYHNYATVSLRYDSIPPAGSVASSPAYSNVLSFDVSWTAGSDAGGSGLTGRYDIRVRDGGNPWSNWLNDYAGLSATYNGVDGHQYYFEAASRDSAGNIEIFTGAPECSTIVDTVRPYVTSTIPAAGDTGVALNSNITVTFSEPMDSATIVNANFSIIGTQSGSHVFNISYDPNDYLAILDPDTNFTPEETVTVTVRQPVSDRAGNQMALDRIWTFRIGTLVDTMGPVTSSGNVLPNPCEPIANLALSAYVSDAGQGDHIINAAEFFTDSVAASGTGTALAPADTFWNEISEDVVGAHDNQPLIWAVGDTHKIFIHGRDAPGNWGNFDTVRVAVIPDDDTLGPDFSGFNPVSWPDTANFFIECQITDPSGVYDDSTGSSGQGVYLRWDNDGEIVIDAHEITMSLSFGSYYRSDSMIPVQSAGANFVYEVYAFDDDYDTQHPGDRKKAGSGLQNIAILDVRGPQALNTAALPNPTQGALALALTAVISDSLRGDSPIRSAEYFIDAPGIDSTGYALRATDGVFDQIREAVTDTLDISSWPYGTFRWLFVHGRDSVGNWGGFDSVQVSVTPPDDTIPPYITATSPDSGETGVALNRNVYLTFSEPMSPASFDSSKIHILGSVHPLYRYGFAYDTLTCTAALNPDSLFAAQETVQVDVSSALTDTAGNSMLDPYFFYFVTGLQSDTTGPRIMVWAAYPDTTLGARNCLVTATISDSATGQSVIRAAEIFVDSIGPAGTGYPMSPTDSVWDEIVESAYRRHDIRNLSLGMHWIYLRGRDDAGNWGGLDSLSILVTPDDDTLGPTFADFRPDSTPDTSGFYIYCTITDPSGVYDDSTGAAGQGVYLVWNVTGFRLSEDMEMLMSRTAGDTFRTDYKVPQQSDSAYFSYEVFAYDNDFDFVEPEDRSQSRSGPRTIAIYDARGPATSYIQVSPPNPPAGITRVVVYASVSDSLTGRSPISAAETFLDSTGLPGAGFAMHPLDGAFDEVQEGVFDTIPVSGWLAGQTHKFYVRGRDAHANWGRFDSISIYVSPYIDTIPPGIAATVPAQGDTGVARNTWIYVTFTERVDPTTVTSDKILIEGDSGGVYTFWMSYNSLDSTLSINPYNNFAPQESVTVWISSGIKDLAGNMMPNGYSWWFRTGATLDTLPPIVTNLNVTPDTIFPDSFILLTAYLTDNQSVDTAEYFIDTIGVPGTGRPARAVGGFGPPAVSVFDTIFGDSLNAGRHAVYLHGQDGSGNWGKCDSVRFWVAVRDTVGPTFTISFDPNPANIGDSVRITAIASEILHPNSAVVCTVWTSDSVPYCLKRDTIKTDTFAMSVSTVGFANGDCQAVVHGRDLESNSGSAHAAFHVGPAGEFLPPEMVYAWPNPGRGNEVNFHFYINQNARVKVEVFNLTGRRIAVIEGRGEGGRPPHLVSSNALVWNIAAIASDVYLFRLSAESDVPGTKGSVLKKFAIVK